MECYHNPNPGKTPNTRRYRGISYASPIDAAKEAVPVIDLADLLCGPGRLRKVGNEWAGRCPLPDHEDRSPSFTANPEKNVWFCHGCLRGGDVVELYRLAEGYDQREAHTAAAMLLMEFGHDLPERPPSWSAKQYRQAKARQALYEAKVESVQRRMFRHLSPILEDIQSSAEREAEAEYLWKACHRIGQCLVEGQTK
jgi:DNA primase